MTPLIIALAEVLTLTELLSSEKDRRSFEMGFARIFQHATPEEKETLREMVSSYHPSRTIGREIALRQIPGVWFEYLSVGV